MTTSNGTHDHMGENSTDEDSQAERHPDLRSLNILQVNKLYHPVVGGIETVVRDVATGLVDRGHDARVLAATTSGRGGLSTMEGVRVRKTASLGRVQSVPISPTFPVRLYQEARNADIIHHHLPNPLGPLSHTLTPSSGARTVVTYHSDIVRQQNALKAYAPILRSFLDDVDQILVTSPRLLKHSDFLEPYSEKCTVIPLSIDAEQISDPAVDGNSASVEGTAIDADEPIVLFVGRLNYYKGVEYLIDAMKTLDATLLVVGEGEQRDPLEQRAREQGVAGRIVFLGHVDDETLASCYDAADVFVLPSVEPSEAFGIVQLEAMAHEVPVVNTALSTGVPWVSQDEGTGLTVPPRDSDALANAISKLLADDEQRRILGRRGRKRVLDSFTRDRMLNRIETVYANVLSE